MAQQHNQPWDARRIQYLRYRLGKASGSRRGISQVIFAERVGVGVRTIAQWEAGHAQPSTMSAFALDELEAEV